MSEPPRLIKKYPNRRLYDTKTSVYITLADVKKLVMGGEEFQVVDAKTGEDLTRSILLQHILEEKAAEPDAQHVLRLPFPGISRSPGIRRAIRRAAVAGRQ